MRLICLTTRSWPIQFHELFSIPASVWIKSSRLIPNFLCFGMVDCWWLVAEIYFSDLYAILPPMMHEFEHMMPLSYSSLPSQQSEKMKYLLNKQPNYGKSQYDILYQDQNHRIRNNTWAENINLETQPLSRSTIWKE